MTISHVIVLTTAADSTAGRAFVRDTVARDSVP
jgi:hypothetical protein